jgi:N-acetylmuramoyl-L-alanine amidase CwlA
MTIKQNLVPSSKYSLKCPHPMTPEYITVHNTANDAPALNEAKYVVDNPKSKDTSYHFAVDDKEVYQILPLNRAGWHAGDGNGTGNRKTIGIEICYSKSGGERFNKAEDNAAWLIAKLLKERNWGIDRVKKHQDWSGKYCPHRTLDNGWQRFLDKITSQLGGSMSDDIEALKKELDKRTKERDDAKTDRGNTYHALGLVEAPGPDSDYDNKKVVKRAVSLVEFEKAVLDNLKRDNLEGALAVIGGLRSRITTLDNEVGPLKAQVTNKAEELSRVEGQLTIAQSDIKTLNTKLNNALADVDKFARDKGNLAIELQLAKQTIETLKAGGNYTPPTTNYLEKFFELLTKLLGGKS